MSDIEQLRVTIRTALERAHRLHKQGIETAEAERLRESIGEAERGLAALGAAGERDEGRLGAGEWGSWRRDLLHIRAISHLQAFELAGQFTDLTEGLALLRQSADLAALLPNKTAALSIGRALVVALTRAGEQRDNIELLREAERRIADLSVDIDPKTAAEENYDLLNAAAVAGMRLGQLTGDRVKVETACRDLSRFINRDDVGGEARSQTTRNLLSTLTANARQNRSERVYRQLLDVVNGVIAARPSIDPYYLQYRGTIRLELSGVIAGESRAGEAEKLARDAIADLTQLVSALREDISAHVTAMHSLAQAYFQLGKQLRSAANLKAAVEKIEETLKLAGNTEGDARVTRIIADLGTYRYAYGIVAQDHGMIAEARCAYEDAVARTDRLAAPALFAQIARGLFVLLFQRKDWSAALELFASIEEAWDRIIADPALSSEVFDQLASDLAGQYDRAARCEIELGRPSRAVEKIERGRARRLAQARILQARDPSPGPHREELARAEEFLIYTRRRGSAEETRRAWEGYLSARRRANLDRESLKLSGQDIRRAAPAGGAIVQIFAADEQAGAFITLAVGAAPDASDYEPILVPLAHRDFTAIRDLLTDDRQAQREGWSTAYRRYVSDVCVEEWNAHVDASLAAIGKHLMVPIDAALRSHLPPGSPVVLSPPGHLAALPMLCAPIEGKARFCDRWSASVTPSVAALSAPTAHDCPLSLLVISDPLEVDRSLAPLPLARYEAEDIETRFPPDRRRHLTQGDATVHKVLDLLPTGSLIHIASHGVYDWEQPNQSGLELARGRRLTVAQIAASPGSMRETRLVFLSACESGIAGQTVTPDEFVGLLPAFLMCGAHAAIGTLWPVFDDAAMLLSCRFYSEFLDEHGCERCPPATAMARAQDWLRNAQTEEIQALNERAAGSRFAHGISTRYVASLRRHDGGKHLSVPPLHHADRPFAAPIHWAGFVVLGR